jgi:hypothetical protein
LIGNKFVCVLTLLLKMIMFYSTKGYGILIMEP